MITTKVMVIVVMMMVVMVVTNDEVSNDNDNNKGVPWTEMIVATTIMNDNENGSYESDVCN